VIYLIPVKHSSFASYPSACPSFVDLLTADGLIPIAARYRDIPDVPWYEMSFCFRHKLQGKTAFWPSKNAL